MENKNIDALQARGFGGGSTARKLLANNMNPLCLRTNDTMTFKAWESFDDQVNAIYQQRLVGVEDLMSRGLVHRTNGLADLSLHYQDVSDLNDAEIDMDGVVRTKDDRHEYASRFLPLPLTHKGFSMGARELAASRQGGSPLDTTLADGSTLKVAEKIESTLFKGANAYNAMGGIIRGYEDHPDRNTGSLTAAWDGTATGEEMVADALAMKQVSIDDRKYGKWVLYVSTSSETALDEDYKSNSDKTVRQRILEIEGIESIKVIDFMTTGGVLLISMQSDVVRMVEGLAPLMVEDETNQGMLLNFNIMAINVPQVRSDQSLRSGVVHYT